MGFYAPATIVEDTKRHGVTVRPVDAQTSNWDCTLEPYSKSAGGFALRMGLRYVKGLGDWKKIETARITAPLWRMACRSRAADLPKLKSGS